MVLSPARQGGREGLLIGNEASADSGMGFDIWRLAWSEGMADLVEGIFPALIESTWTRHDWLATDLAFRSRVLEAR